MTRSRIQTTLSLVMAATLLLSSIDAFAPSSAQWRTTPPASTQTTCTNTRQSSQRLFVVADPPNREGEKEKLNKDDNDHNTEAWVKTDNGGFLPKIPRVFKERIGRRHNRQQKQRQRTAPEQVATIQEYKAVVADERERIVCVRFYAPWCKACQAVEQPFRKLCRDHYPHVVKFVEVPLTRENAFLHQGLGIPSLPYGHIYDPEVGLVEERKIKKREFATFASILDTYVQGECPVEYSKDGICQPVGGTPPSVAP